MLFKWNDITFLRCQVILTTKVLDQRIHHVRFTHVYISSRSECARFLPQQRNYKLSLGLLPLYIFLKRSILSSACSQPSTFFKLTA